MEHKVACKLCRDELWVCSAHADNPDVCGNGWCGSDGQPCVCRLFFKSENIDDYQRIT